MPPVNIILAFALDLVLGDPRGLPHPVEVIGKAVTALERLLLRPGRKPAVEKAAGVVLVLMITLPVFFTSYYLIILAARYLGGMAGMAVAVYLAYTTIAARGLADAANEVFRPLSEGDIGTARKKLSMVVGRDTDGLDEKEVARGAVETVAENTSDGIVAPLFYLALGGAPLALVYKAINTLDSMVGYRSDKYRHFGWAAARLDDLANFIPARLTGLLMVVAAYVLSLLEAGRYSWKGAWRVLVRDRSNHTSPNSGYPEAAAAGALDVRLGGENSYFGVASVKPFIGDPVEPLSAGKITAAVRLMYVTAVLMVVVAGILSIFLSF